MDFRRHGNFLLHHGVNGGIVRTAKPGEEDGMQFLSREEKECLQYFEKTIDSLEDSLEDDDRRLAAQVKPLQISSAPAEEVDGPPTSSPNPGVTVSSLLNRATSPKDHVDESPISSSNPGATASSLLNTATSPKDQDIIDLVRPGPDLVQTKELTFSPINPDFQSMLQTPESHFEIKPRHDPSDGLPSEYNPPLPSGSYGSTDSHSSYHPPGCIPTPVLIAQKIAENQGGGTSTALSSALLRRRSLESEKPPSYSTDLPMKQGPPTTAKPSRYPANISVILGSKEQAQSLSNVNINERRAQMLANLSGTSHPLLQENSQQPEEQKARNTPTRSISFRDPTPDKSRMEALSKLGLNRSRAMSGGMSLLVTPDNASLSPLTNADTSARSQEASPSPTMATSPKFPDVNVTPPLQSPIHASRTAEILRRDSLRTQEDRNPQPISSPPAVTYGNPQPIPSPPAVIYGNPQPMPSPPAVTYGNPQPIPSPSAVTYKSPQPIPSPPAVSYGNPQPIPSPPAVTHSSHYPPPFEIDESFPPPPPEVNTLEFNSYGGKSIVVNPSVFSKNEPANSPTSPEPKSLSPALSNPAEFNSYGGKSKVMTPALNRSDLPDILSSHIDNSEPMAPKPEPLPTDLNSFGGKSRTINPITGLSRPSERPSKGFKAPAPAPAPKPLRHSYHSGTTPQKPVVSPDYKKRPNSMFRPQGISVEFGGRGASTESRNEALRKLGLLKD